MMNWDEKYLEESLRKHIDDEIHLVYPNTLFVSTCIRKELHKTEQFECECYYCFYNIINDIYNQKELKDVYANKYCTIKIHNDSSANYLRVNKVNKLNNEVINVTFDLYIHDVETLNIHLLDILHIKHLLDNLNTYKESNSLYMSVDYYIGYFEAFYKYNFSCVRSDLNIDNVINKFKTTDIWKSYVSNKNYEEKNIIETYFPYIIYEYTDWQK